jgi:hypothetical protein
MNLYNARWIVPGLIAFVAIVTFPLWFNNAQGRAAGFTSPPNPEGLECVEKGIWMREHHMQLLIDWRETVVREGDRTYIGSDGKTYEKSLTKTCMKCHGFADETGKSTTPATYCLDCHNFAGVTVYCWDCHIDPVPEGRLE